MNYKCKYCGSEFEPDQEQKDLLEDGWINNPDCCEDCDPNGFGSFDYQDYSDADPGL